MKRQIMICVGVMIPDDEQQHPLFRIVEEELSEAARKVASSHAECEYDSRVAFIYLGDGCSNAKQCDQCGCWATDYEQPLPIACLVHGNHIEGKFLCGHCPPYSRPRISP